MVSFCSCGVVLLLEIDDKVLGLIDAKVKAVRFDKQERLPFPPAPTLELS